VQGRESILEKDLGPCDPGHERPEKKISVRNRESNASENSTEGAEANAIGSAEENLFQENFGRK
jgi:hypothetical protein